jgi:hypothetical protein
VSGLSRRVGRKGRPKRKRVKWKRLPVELPDGTVVPHTHPDAVYASVPVYIGKPQHAKPGERCFPTIDAYKAWAAARDRKWLAERGLEAKKR